MAGGPAFRLPPHLGDLRRRSRPKLARKSREHRSFAGIANFLDAEHGITLLPEGSAAGTSPATSTRQEFPHWEPQLPKCAEAVGAIGAHPALARARRKRVGKRRPRHA